MLAGLTSGALAQEQTTQQLRLPQRASTQSYDQRWQATFDSSINYTVAKTSGVSAFFGDTRTRQVQTPIGFALTGRPNELWKIDLGMRGSYVDVTQKNNLSSVNFSGFLDTSLTSAATYYGFSGFQPFVSLNMNLPTGRTNFAGSASGGAKPDPDIFQIAGFGEGLNVGPTVGVSIPLSQSSVVSFAVGETLRGQFTRDDVGFGIGPGSGLTEQLRPGDVTTLTATYGYAAGPFSFQAQGAYSWETLTMVDDTPFYKAGNRFQLSLAAGYAWTEQWSSRLMASFSHFDKNNILNPPPPGTYGLEPFNSNNDVVNVTFDTTYRQGAWLVGPTAGLMFRQRNGYDPTTFQFVSAKTGWTAGGVAQYAITNQASLILRAQHMWLSVDGSPPKSPLFDPGSARPELRSDAWLLSLGGTIQF